MGEEAAASLGADVYMVKEQFNEREILETLGQLLARPQTTRRSGLAGRGGSNG